MTKKYWIIALLALGIAGCSDDDKKDDTQNQVPATECTNNDECIAKDPSKPVCNTQGVCEAAAPQKECTNNDECIAKDPNKPVCNAQGVCEAAAPQKECENNDECIAKDPQKPVCNAQGVCEAEAPQKECENNDECIAKDPTKPVCNAQGVCEAEAPQKECANNDECIAKDPTKPVCNAQGVCEAEAPQKECANNDECIAKDPNKPVCNSDGVCEAAPSGKECSNNGECALKYTDRPVCNAEGMCEAAQSTDTCEEAEVIETDYQWCQLMGPINVELDSSTATATLNARVIFGGITDKTRDNDGELDAQLIYGEDVTAKDLATWPHIDAVGINIDDCIMDGYSATLSSYNLSLLNSDKVFYTFRFKKAGDDDAEWIYCKHNEEGQDENAINRNLTVMKEDNNGKVEANAHIIGEANYVGNLSNIIAKFNFDKGTGTQGKTEPYNADAGTGAIQGLPATKISCPQNNCFGNHDSGKALNFGGFKKAKADALEDGAHILISGMSTSGATGINLDMVISRTNGKSADKMVILYSTDGENYVEQADVVLYPDGTAAEKQINNYYPQSIAFPAAAENAATFSIKLVPYGNEANPIRIDDVIISKNNE